MQDDSTPHVLRDYTAVKRQSSTSDTTPAESTTVEEKMQLQSAEIIAHSSRLSSTAIVVEAMLTPCSSSHLLTVRDATAELTTRLDVEADMKDS